MLLQLFCDINQEHLFQYELSNQINFEYKLNENQDRIGADILASKIFKSPELIRLIVLVMEIN